MSFEIISVIGLGYIGLPTAAMFAFRKKKVIGVDVNREAVDTINRGEIHIVEPELDNIVHSAVAEGFLRATMSTEPADAFLIAVPTPFKKKESDIPEPDLSYIEAACAAIAPVLKKGDLVILESTSPVGTTEQMAEWLAAARVDLSFPQYTGEQADVNIAYCPERVLPGQVVQELVENDRIIGGISPTCSRRAAELYKIIVEAECLITNARTAEMAKLTENSCRDVQIAFANELSIICDEQNINVWELIKLANKHPRVNILQPGPGVGGHCVAVDPWFIVHSNPSSAQIIKLARQANDAKPNWVVSKIKQAISYELGKDSKRTEQSVSLAFYGMSFKPNIDDFRESPALKIINEIYKNHQCKLLVVEPNVTSRNQFEFDVTTQLSDAVDYDIHIMLVDHDEFKKVTPPSERTVIDTRGIWQTTS
jgi:UDP-N-acetyl-D-mannosaminuronic acid dehydrogenase